jgi:hypothetical protein
VNVFPSLMPSSLDALVAEALAMEASAAKEAGTLGFMARALVQATLPHRAVTGSEFTRRNGAFTLTLLAPAHIGLPYGSMPRLLLAWLSTEAVRTQSRELELGDTLTWFMQQLDLIPTGGRWGSITRLKSQTRRLFAATISASFADQNHQAEAGYRLADRSVLWWDASTPDQAGLWRSTVTLTEPFFREVVDHPVPIDMRAIKALKRSPLALDLYCWLSYRLSYLKKPTTIPWAALALQFGSDYGRLRDFRAAFLDELRKVSVLYPEARLDQVELGLVLKPGRPHVPR